MLGPLSAVERIVSAAEPVLYGLYCGAPDGYRLRFVAVGSPVFGSLSPWNSELTFLILTGKSDKLLGS